MQLFAVNQIGALNLELITLGRYLAHHTLYVVNAVFLNRAAVELIKVFTRGTHVYIEHINLGIGVFIPYKHCVLCGIHTAYFRAIFLALFSACLAP